MKIVAVFFTVLGVLALLAMPATDMSHDNASAEAVAVNFVQYRTAANNVALFDPPASGGKVEEPETVEGWQAIRPWDNRMDGNHFYVFGPASEEEIHEIKTLLRGSISVTTQDGAFPSFIPAGAVVSVIEVGS